MEIISGLLLLVAIIAIVILAYKYATLVQQIDTLAEKKYKQWRETELEAIKKEQKEIAEKEAKMQLQQWINEHNKATRDDAVKKSKATISGQVAEQLAPYLPGFKYNPKDARFLGAPIDYIIFDGLSEGQLKEIIFLEVKTNSSSLNRNQRLIREIIKSGKVSWDQFHWQQ